MATCRPSAGGFQDDASVGSLQCEVGTGTDADNPRANGLDVVPGM